MVNVDDEGRRHLIEGALTIGAATAAGVVAFKQFPKGEQPEGAGQNHETQGVTPKTVRDTTIQASTDESEHKPLIDKPLVKVMRGEIQITKLIPVDGRMETLGIRRDTIAPQRHKDNPVLRWEDVEELEGVKVKGANNFSVLNAGLVIGDPVDLLGNEVYWIKLKGKLTTGEELYTYISRSTKTENHIYEATAKDEPLYKDWGGNIIPPYNGLNVVSVPPTPVK